MVRQPKLKIKVKYNQTTNIINTDLNQYLKDSIFAKNMYLFAYANFKFMLY